MTAYLCLFKTNKKPNQTNTNKHKNPKQTNPHQNKPQNQATKKSLKTNTNSDDVHEVSKAFLI